MFQLTVVDHIRLSFGSVVTAYGGHAAAAARLSRRAWYAKVAMLSFVALAAVAVLLAQGRGPRFHVTAGALAALGFVACALYVALDPEPRIYAHRATAARLWLLCEKYRALLTEVHDELLDVPSITRRRDALLQETSRVFEQSPPADQQTDDIVRRTLLGEPRGDLRDGDLDQLLPAALRRA
jgi:hypothetical protein